MIPQSPDRLTDRSYWDAVPYMRMPNTWALRAPLSLFDAHLIRLLKTVVHPGARFLEIGVAPGLHTTRLCSRLQVEAFGIDFSLPGIEQARKNFASSGFNPDNVKLLDFMTDDDPPSGFANGFDLVFSNGLVEHFIDVNRSITRHMRFVRPGGHIFIAIPNLAFVKPLVPPDLLAIHNLEIMSPEALAACLPADLALVECGYFGGVADLGIFVARNTLVNSLRIAGYVVQRLTADMIQRGLLHLGIDLSNKWLSPGIYVLARQR